MLDEIREVMGVTPEVVLLVPSGSVDLALDLAELLVGRPFQ